MPNTAIPSGTDLRNFLVPLEALESVAGMRFLGGDNGLDAKSREELNEVTAFLREMSGVPSLSAAWGSDGVGRGYRPAEVAKRDVQGVDDRKQAYGHLCAMVSCQAVSSVTQEQR